MKTIKGIQKLLDYTSKKDIRSIRIDCDKETGEFRLFFL